MFEGLEKGWTEDKRRSSDRTFLALSVFTLAFLVFVGIFEPRMIEHGIFDVIVGLALIAMSVGTLVKWIRAKRHNSN